MTITRKETKYQFTSCEFGNFYVTISSIDNRQYLNFEGVQGVVHDTDKLKDYFKWQMECTSKALKEHKTK